MQPTAANSVNYSQKQAEKNYYDTGNIGIVSAVQYYQN
jgi:hypothetical protein